ncbi:MAG: hypothetical protein QXX95_05285, partial [Nitrososphaerales archaeon]
WYVDALMRLGLDYEQVERGRRNSIDWFLKGEEKRRLKALYNSFPFRASISSMTKFLSVFIGL